MLALINKMKKRINQFFVFSLMTLMISSCESRHKFDTEEWKRKEVDWWITDFREKMVDDLIQSDTLIGMNQKQVIEMLGQPESKEGQKFEYTIREKYRTDIDPEYISNLQIEFNDEGQVKSCNMEK